MTPKALGFALAGDPRKPTAPSGILRDLLPALLIAAALAAAYANSLGGPFVLDDLPSIADNPTIRHWGTALSTPVESSTHGRPVLNLSFALNYAVSGREVWSYHLLNLAIHCGCALLLYGIVRRTLAGSHGGDARLLAAFSALLWAVHPLDTAAVTYTVQRAESLMGLFLLLTLYGFIRCAGAGPGAGRAWAVLSVGSCLLGMATKEVMAVAPVLVLLYDRTFVAGSFRAALRSRPVLYAGLAAGWLLLGALVASTHGRGGTAGFGSGVPVWAYALTQARAIIRYLGLSVYPSPLVFYYGRFLVTDPWAAALPALAVAGLAGLAAAAVVRFPRAGFLGAAFFLILAPSSSIVPVATETVAEHRMYLALAPLAVGAVLLVRRWAGRGGLAVLAAAVTALGLATHARNEDYRSALSLWTQTVRDDPGNPWARSNLGCALDEAPGRAAEAVAQFEEAIRLKPDHAEAHYNLACDLMAQPGRLPEAIAHFGAAVAAAPGFAKAHNNLGAALAGVPGRLDEAVAHYREAIRLNPGYAEAHYNLGNALAAISGREGEAVREYEAAAGLRPDYAEAHRALGRLLAGVPGSLDPALAHLRRVIEIRPGSPEAHYDLGTVLSGIPDRRDDAIRELQEAIRLRPGYAEARNNLANLWAVMPGRWEDAIAEYRKAEELQPGYAEAHYNLAVALLLRPGNEDEARSQLEGFLRLAPGNAQGEALLKALGER